MRSEALYANDAGRSFVHHSTFFARSKFGGDANVKLLRATMSWSSERQYLNLPGFRVHFFQNSRSRRFAWCFRSSRFQRRADIYEDA
jgi:hypothetical protein